MQKLETGKIEINSQFEASRVGRLAVFESDDTELLVKHDGYKSQAISESEFITREYDVGPLIIGVGRSRAVVAAIGHILRTQEPYNKVTVAQAVAMDKALAKIPEQDDALLLSEEELQKHISSIAVYAAVEPSNIILELHTIEKTHLSNAEDLRSSATAA